MLPTLRRRHRQSRRTVITTAVPTSLRSIWRFLDTLDDVEGLRVESLSDVNDLHGTQYLRSNPRYSDYVAVKGYIVHSRQALGLPPVFWPPAPEPEFKPADVPEDAVVRAAYSELKRKVFDAKQRWADAPGLAVGGTNWAGKVRPKTKAWSTADAHATLGGIIALSGDPVPDSATVGRFIRKKMALNVFPKPWGPARVLFATLYPTKADVLHFFYLFLLRTGWNAQVALDLDISTSDWARPHPTSDEHMMVYSTKSRGNTIQSYPSRINSTTEPFALVTTLLEVSAPLRKKLVERLKASEAELKSSPNDMKLLESVTDLKAAIRSPWLFFDSRDIGSVVALNLKNYAYLDGHTNGWSVFVSDYNERTRAIHQRLESEGVELKPPTYIPKTLKLSDLRDAFVSHAYAASGYSWLVAKLAAGHKSLRSLQRYLRQRQWRAHGEQKVVSLTDALWSEIKIHRTVEPAFLRAMVERGEITEAQRERWLEHKDRTRMGTGCRNSRNPPRAIAPEHIEGTVCRVQRCVLCEHAVVFDDSLPELARRMAELEVLRKRLSLTTWLESTFPDEFEALNRTLDSFAADAVAEHLQYWRTEIAEGRHRIFDMEGAYE